MLPSLNGVGTQITWTGSLDLVDWLPVEKAVSIAGQITDKIALEASQWS